MYATIEDVRDEGLLDEDSGGVDDTTVARWLLEAQEIVDNVTRNHFEPVVGTFIFDGNNSHLLHLPMSIVSVDSLTVNNGEIALDPTLFRVYNGQRRPQDDRRNPKIELRIKGLITIPVVIPLSPISIFRKGWDQTVVGTFGWIEPDGSVPILIRRCTVAIVMTMADQLFFQYSGGRGAGVGPVTREKTDDHELQFGANIRDVGTYVLPTGIENKLLWFRAPLSARAPTVRWSDIGWHRTFSDDHGHGHHGHGHI